MIIELLSESIAQTDRSLKKELYQNRFRTPEYFWFSPETLEFAGYRLVNQQYELIPETESGWLWSQSLGLYLGTQAGMLRYFTESGNLVLSPEEALQRLTEQLRALGVEPNL